MDWKLETIYIGCAAAGGTILVIQTITLLTGGGDHDADAVHVDHSEIGNANSGEVHTQDASFGLFSVRTIAAFLTFFGLAGWAGVNSGWSTLATLGVALAAGTAMLFGVAWLFHMQKRLSASGNVNPTGAVGQTAQCYLRIPPANTGKGKITLVLQGRSVEFTAFTNGREIQTGAEVRVVRQVTSDTFEVESLS